MVWLSIPTSESLERTRESAALSIVPLYVVRPSEMITCQNHVPLGFLPSSLSFEQGKGRPPLHIDQGRERIDRRRGQ